MNMCQTNHEMVSYYGAKCPVCEKMNEITDLKGEIDNLKDDLRDLNEEIATNKRP